MLSTSRYLKVFRDILMKLIICQLLLNISKYCRINILRYSYYKVFQGTYVFKEFEHLSMEKNTSRYFKIFQVTSKYFTNFGNFQILWNFSFSSKLFQDIWRYFNIFQITLKYSKVHSDILHTSRYYTYFKIPYISQKMFKYLRYSNLLLN